MIGIDGDGWAGQSQNMSNVSPFTNLPSTSMELIDAPIQVEKIHINYAKRANRIDIELLKNSIWGGLAESNKLNEQKMVPKVQQPKNFTEVLQTVPKVLPKAQVDDLSIPLCFICLLELANKKGLQIEEKGNELVITDYQFQ